MKKLVILILVVVSLFSMVACGDSNKDVNKGVSVEPNDTSGAGSYADYDYEDKDARDEAIYRREKMQKLEQDPKMLASFLVVMHVLPIDTATNPEAMEIVVATLAEDGEMRQWALEMAEKLISEMHIDSNWAEPTD